MLDRVDHSTPDGSFQFGFTKLLAEIAGHSWKMSIPGLKNFIRDVKDTKAMMRGSIEPIEPFIHVPRL